MRPARTTVMLLLGTHHASLYFHIHISVDIHFSTVGAEQMGNKSSHYLTSCMLIIIILAVYYLF